MCNHNGCIKMFLRPSFSGENEKRLYDTCNRSRNKASRSTVLMYKFRYLEAPWFVLAMFQRSLEL